MIAKYNHKMAQLPYFNYFVFTQKNYIEIECERECMPNLADYYKQHRNKNLNKSSTQLHGPLLLVLWHFFIRNEMKKIEKFNFFIYFSVCCCQLIAIPRHNQIIICISAPYIFLFFTRSVVVVFARFHYRFVRLLRVELISILFFPHFSAKTGKKKQNSDKFNFN